MEYIEHAVESFTALGHPGRLAVFRLLARRAPGSVRPGEMIVALGLKPSTLSVYLAALERAGLIVSKRDGKAILYGIDLAAVGGLVDYLVADCCRGRPEVCVPLAARGSRCLGGGTPVPVGQPLNVLFLCVGNSARSILAEAILAELGDGRFRAFSAGTRPHPKPNALALATLRARGHTTDGLRAKDVTEFQRPGAPDFDFVFTLCDSAANEECPPWSGQPIMAHWGMPDPVRETVGEAEQARAFDRTYDALRRRIAAFVALPFAALDGVSLQGRLDVIGADGAPRVATK